MVRDQTYHARVAAMSLAHGAALAKLLRAHGCDEHARNVEAALIAFQQIVTVEVGQPILNEAMTWVNTKVGMEDRPIESEFPRH